ncbi:hypothetical protein H5410_054078 [Solanum commersonii]|uniref:Uncharacterized protein n=1 Tax=Solanum commersonii TaxID=4109 RepID=A0A9J5X5L7_SOLCO|nr:hypothetical protein H5410_054078 [Solanum commersonii]
MVQKGLACLNTKLESYLLMHRFLVDQNALAMQLLAHPSRHFPCRNSIHNDSRIHQSNNVTKYPIEVPNLLPKSPFL